MVLRTLNWEISSVTALDFLDHILLRLGMPSLASEVQMEELKLRIETILALAVTEYAFSYLNPSLLTASAIQLVLSRFNPAICDDWIDGTQLYKIIKAEPVSLTFFEKNISLKNIKRSFHFTQK